MSPIEDRFPGNSRRDKSSKKPPKLEKVGKSKVIVKEPDLGQKVKESFTSEAGKSILEYLILDVVVPNTKSLILDLVNQGLERRFYGDGSPRSRAYSSRKTSGYQSYNRAFQSSTKPINTSQSRPSSSVNGPRFKNIIVGDRGEAEMHIDILSSRIDEYDVATLADLYELVGISGDFTDYKYGWTDSRGFRVRPVRDGYLLDLPEPKPID